MASPFQDMKGALIGQGRTAEIYAWGSDQVLKLYRAGWPATIVEHESRVSRIIADSGIPSPAVEGVISLDGRTGIIFERLVGPSLLRQMATRIWTLPHAVGTFANLHLAVHSVEVPDSDFPSQREVLARQIGEARDVPERARVAAVERLEQLPEGSAICHGDFHPDNVLLTQRGPIIIDWMTAFRGHPLADVARTELLFLISQPPFMPSRIQRGLLESARTYVRRSYVRRYLRRRGAHEDELAAWRLPVAVARAAEGIAEEQGALLRLIARLMSMPQ